MKQITTIRTVGSMEIVNFVIHMVLKWNPRVLSLYFHSQLIIIHPGSKYFLGHFSNMNKRTFSQSCGNCMVDNYQEREEHMKRVRYEGSICKDDELKVMLQDTIGTLQTSIVSITAVLSNISERLGRMENEIHILKSKNEQIIPPGQMPLYTPNANGILPNTNVISPRYDCSYII